MPRVGGVLQLYTRLYGVLSFLSVLCRDSVFESVAAEPVLCSVSIPVVSITHITVIMKMSQRGARCRARSQRACHAHTALPLPIVRGAQVR